MSTAGALADAGGATGRQGDEHAKDANRYHCRHPLERMSPPGKTELRIHLGRGADGTDDRQHRFGARGTVLQRADGAAAGQHGHASAHRAHGLCPQHRHQLPHTDRGLPVQSRWRLSHRWRLEPRLADVLRQGWQPATRPARRHIAGRKRTHSPFPAHPVIGRPLGAALSPRWPQCRQQPYGAPVPGRHAAGPGGGQQLGQDTKRNGLRIDTLPGLNRMRSFCA